MTLFVWLVSMLSAVLPVQLPPVNAAADYQLGGAYSPAPGVKIVSRDMTAAPAKGRYSICYVNAFQTQPGELPWWKANHPDLLLTRNNGTLVRDKDWPDEVILDLRTAAKRSELASVTDGWFAECARKGFQAVEPDNLDSWTRSAGLIKRADTVSFVPMLIDQAHQHGLAIAQKNAAELTGSRLGFDFAVAEECEVYRECDSYFKTYGNNVIEIEYTDNGKAAFARACRNQGKQISVILRDRDLVRRGQPHYAYESC